jgi:phosphoserine phosphatase RsbU/P
MFVRLTASVLAAIVAFGARGHGNRTHDPSAAVEPARAVPSVDGTEPARVDRSARWAGDRAGTARPRLGDRIVSIRDSGRIGGRPPRPVLPLPAVAAGFLVGCAAALRRGIGTRLTIRKRLTYAIVSRGFLAIEATVVLALLSVVAAPLMRLMRPDPALVLASGATLAALVGVAVGLVQLNRRALRAIDRWFFRDTYDAQRILTDLSRAIRQMASRPEQLLERVATEIVAALHPSRLAIFLAPSACPRLVPVAEPRGACWNGASADVGSDAFRLCIDKSPAGIADPVAAIVPLPFTRVPLARHLGLSAAGDPETLDVVPSPVRAAFASRGPRADDGPVGPCLGDTALYARFAARLVVPIVTNGRVLGFLLLGAKRSEEPYSSGDKELLLTVAGQMAIAFDYAQLIAQAAEQASLRRELQIAQDVQARLFPRERPAMRTLRYAGICRAARGVGGDFYDFLPLTGNRLGLAVADIAGKGLPAALLMASLQALLRSHAPTYASDLGDLGRELNRHLCETSDGARFATLFFGVYDDETRRLRYLNAGHVAPLVVRPGPECRASVTRLESGGMVLGLFGSQGYDQGEVALRSGERLLVFSDGVTEAADAAGEMFGDERLVAATLDATSLDIETLASRLVEEVDRFVGGAPQQDDITVIAAEVV